MFSDEQYAYWEQQLREELYPCSQQEGGSELENDEQQFSSLTDDSNFFNDSDDDYLQEAVDGFQPQTQSRDQSNSTKARHRNIFENDLPPSSKIDQNLVHSQKEVPPTAVPKVTNSTLSRRRSLSTTNTSPNRTNVSKSPAIKKLDFQSFTNQVSNDLEDVEYNDLDNVLTQKYEISTLNNDSSYEDNLNESNISTQSKNGVIHWQSFQKDSDDELELEVDGNEENYEIVSQWVTDTQLDHKIANNKAAQKVIQNRKRNSKRNQFLLDEAEDAFDNKECFLEDFESQDDIGDESLKSFISDDHMETTVSGHHLQSLLTQNPTNEIPEKFKLKKPIRNDILSDTDESDNDEENEYDLEDSFISENIIYEDESPEKVIQTQKMRLRSKRLINRRNEIETPEKPKPKKRRAVIESP